MQPCSLCCRLGGRTAFRPWFAAPAGESFVAQPPRQSKQNCVPPLQIQRAADPQPWPGHHMRVNLCGRNIFVPQQLLNRADVVARFKEMGGKTVTQAVARRRLGDPGQPEASFTARCSPCSPTWCRLTTSARGSREKPAAGKTYCQPHSRSAAGYFWLSAYGR